MTQIALVIVPEEAELLLPIMRTCMPPSTHLILYAAPWTKTMLHFNNLLYYSLPELPDGWAPPDWLPFELGILAGRLYFTFSEYEDIINRLYSPSGNTSEDNESADLWAEAKNRLNFLQEWLAVRRQGEDVTETPMGYVCQDWPLPGNHPFFTSRKIKTDDVDDLGLQSLRLSSPDEDEHDSCDEDDDIDDVHGDDDDVYQSVPA